jgi:hypothetical protein
VNAAGKCPRIVTGSLSRRFVQRASGPTLVLSAIAGLHACGGSPAPEPTPAEPPARVAALPADLVVLIDNSRSIRDEAQKTLVRETTQILADLADEDDRIAVVTFGDGGRVLVSRTIAGDQDRLAFKQAIRPSLDFAEGWSDIRAGLRAVADGRDALFRPAGQSKRVAVVFSDGRLEAPPATGTPDRALAEMDALLANDLKDIEIYAIVLAQPGSLSGKPVPGLGSLTGDGLMETRIARVADRYYRAESLDELLDITLLILKKAKGISSLGESRGTDLVTDDTVEAVSFIVRKRSSAGDALARSDQIQLKAPGPSPEGRTITAASTADAPAASVYWTGDYSSFDLLIVRRPQAGRWRVALADGREPSVLTRVVTPIELVVDVRPVYYLNEWASVSAWLFDRAAGVPVAAGATGDAFRLQLRAVAAGEDFSPDAPVAGLTFDATSAQYRAVLPRDLPDPLGRTEGQVALQVVAHRREPPGSERMNEWFVRVSPAVTAAIARPFVSWTPLPPQWLRVPLWGRVLPGCRPGPAWPAAALLRHLPCGLPRSGAVLEATIPRARDLREQPYAPVFSTDALPAMVAVVERFDAGRGHWQPAGDTRTLARVSEAAGHVYRGTLAPLQPGEYRYRYVLEGNVDRPWSAERALRLESGWFPARVRSLWPDLLAVLLLASYGLCRLRAGRVRLTGSVTLVQSSTRAEVRGVTTFDGNDLSPDARAALGRAGFTLRTRTWPCFRKQVLLHVEGARGRLDGRSIGAGATVVLKPRPQTLELDAVTLRIDVRAR